MLIRSWEDAEKSAQIWLSQNGYPEAKLTDSGADGGIDIRASNLVAQVKAGMMKVGRPAVQRLAGAARGDRAVFFSLAGYTDHAKDWAREAGVSLFRFDLQGEPRFVGGAPWPTNHQPPKQTGHEFRDETPREVREEILYESVGLDWATLHSALDRYRNSILRIEDASTPYAGIRVEFEGVNRLLQGEPTRMQYVLLSWGPEIALGKKRLRRLLRDHGGRSGRYGTGAHFPSTKEAVGAIRAVFESCALDLSRYQLVRRF